MVAQFRGLRRRLITKADVCHARHPDQYLLAWAIGAFLLSQIMRGRLSRPRWHISGQLRGMASVSAETEIVVHEQLVVPVQFAVAVDPAPVVAMQFAASYSV
jgi:hypothetical protein